MKSLAGTVLNCRGRGRRNGPQVPRINSEQRGAQYLQGGPDCSDWFRVKSIEVGVKALAEERPILLRLSASGLEYRVFVTFVIDVRDTDSESKGGMIGLTTLHLLGSHPGNSRPLCAYGCTGKTVPAGVLAPP